VAWQLARRPVTKPPGPRQEHYPRQEGGCKEELDSELSEKLHLAERTIQGLLCARHLLGLWRVALVESTLPITAVGQPPSVARVPLHGLLFFE
jgi:hypothetical protein